MKIQWVGVRDLREEFKIKDDVIGRWRDNGLIKYKEIEPWTHKDKWGRLINTRWLYDKEYFASIYKDLQKRNFKARTEAAKKYSRKLAAMERDIEMGKI